MKRFTGIWLAASLFLFSVNGAKAQVNISVNIGAQPLWGPTGYDVVQYYYLPDLQTYYYVPSRQFVYLNGSNWVFASSLPARYRGYDLYSGYKVVINEPKPYLHFNTHKVKYASYKGARGKQVVIRDSKEPKYFVVKGHPGNASGHNKAVGGNKAGKGDNGNKGKGKGNKKG